MESASAYALYADGERVSLVRRPPAVFEILGAAEPQPMEFELRVLNAAGVEDSDGGSSFSFESVDSLQGEDLAGGGGSGTPSESGGACSVLGAAGAKQSFVGITALLLGLVGLCRRRRWAQSSQVIM